MHFFKALFYGENAGGFRPKCFLLELNDTDLSTNLHFSDKAPFQTSSVLIASGDFV